MALYCLCYVCTVNDINYTLFEFNFSVTCSKFPGVFFFSLNVLLRNSGVYCTSDIQTAVKALDYFEINVKLSWDSR